VPNLSSNLLYVAKLTQTRKIAKLFPDWFYVHDLKKGQSIVTEGFLDLNDSLYKFYDMNRIDSEMNALVSHIDERSRTLHE
jgi:hypothetical protein